MADGRTEGETSRTINSPHEVGVLSSSRNTKGVMGAMGAMGASRR